jgi:RNA polymerase sigma-70 factor (ECF subfamily)
MVVVAILEAPTELQARLRVQGKPLTAEGLFREHAAFVWRVLRRLGVREADIEDVCQDVFVAVHKQLPSFEGRSKASTWIYGIARRRAADYRRSDRRRREDLTASVPEASGEPAPGSSMDEEVARSQARALLDRLLDQLDDDKREVFVLYEIEELGMREVVEIVGCPLQTGYSRLHAARAELRRAAEAAGVTP